jgi:fibronectin type III domain protein
MLIGLPTSHALNRVGSITLNPGENQLVSAVIDPGAGYAYFGTGNQQAAYIIKIRLSDFTRVSSLNLTSYGEHFFVSAVIDPSHGFAYFGALGGDLVRIRLSDFTRVDAIGNLDFQVMVIDSAGGYIYGGAGGTLGGHITKIRLSDFTQVATMTFNTGDRYFWSEVVDPIGGFGYVGTCCNSSTAEIMKFRLSDLTRIGSLTLNSGENDVVSSVIDPAGGFGYFATSANTIVKVRLSDLSRNATLAPPNTGLQGGLIDPPHDYAYFGADGDNVLRVRLSDLTLAGTLALNGGEGLGRASVFDSSTAFAYLGQTTSPGIVIKIQTASIPAPPSGLTATGGPGKVSLSWAPPSSDGGGPISSYKVYRGTSASTETPYQTLGNVTFYQDAGANVSKTYFYKVTANNTAGESGFSNEASATATPASSTSPLTLPTLLAISLIIAAIAAAVAIVVLMRKRAATKSRNKL